MAPNVLPAQLSFRLHRGFRQPTLNEIRLIQQQIDARYLALQRLREQAEADELRECWEKMAGTG